LLAATLAGLFLSSPTAADPGDLIDDWLAEVAFTGVALSPDGDRLAFATAPSPGERAAPPSGRRASI
jgi:hypothetical protein